MDTESSEIDICIIGGGLSGLTAAYKILSKVSTLQLIILESEERIGGEMFKSDLGELGGKWITPDQCHIIDLLNKFNISISRRNVDRNKHEQKWRWNKGVFAALSRFEIQRFINEIDLKSVSDYRPGRLKVNLRESTMEEYIRSKLFFEQSRNIIRCFVRFIAGVEPGNISLTGDNNMILEFSSEQLLEALEKSINSQCILVKTKVIRVVQYTDYVLIHDDKENVYRASVLIVALPWQIIQRMVFYPPIPHELRIPTFERKHMITSFLIKYPESYWLHKSASLVLHDLGMIGYEYNSRVYAGTVAHDEDFQYILKPIVLKRLAEEFSAEMLTPLDWQQNTWEQRTLLRIPTTSPWNRIVWGSTTAATCYRGFLSGAVQSGYRAAFHALLILRPQSISWQDMNEIQKASAIRPRHSRVKLMLSSLNLYNTSFYICMASVLCLCYKIGRMLNKK